MQIELRDIAAQAVPAVPATAIVTAAVAHLRAREPEIRALAERYRAVAFDLATPKGLAAGRAARHDLRENGRFAIQRGRDATKDLLNAAKKDVETEAERLIALIKPVEDNVHTQIEAREAVLAAEKAERERIEAERVAKHRAELTKLRAYVTLAQGLPSGRIAAGIAAVEAIPIEAGAWEEFFDEADAAKNETLASLRTLLQKTQAAEQEAIEREQQRAEQARIAAEQKIERERLAAEARRLAEEKAELARQAQEIEAARQRAAIAPAPTASVMESFESIIGAPLLCAELEARSITPDAQESGSMPVTTGTYAGNETQAAQVSPSGCKGIGAHAEERAPEPATLTLGKICARLGITMTAAFVSDSLGIQPAATDKSAKLYTERQFSRICAALVDHIHKISELQAA